MRYFIKLSSLHLGFANLHATSAFYYVPHPYAKAIFCESSLRQT